jgi:hypothetical protein
MLGEKSAKERPEGESYVYGGHIDSEDPAPLLRREYRREYGDPCGKDHGASYALKNAEEYQGGGGRGYRAKEGKQGEKKDPIGINPFPPVDVGKPSKGDQGNCGGQKIGGGDPAQEHRVHFKFFSDSRKSHIDG